MTMAIFKKTMLFTTLLAALGGCSNKLHLVTEGYSQADIERLQHALRRQGLAVEQADIMIPGKYPNGVISMPPNFSSPEVITTIQQVLAAQGYQAAEEFKFGRGNHHYLDDIGLYLRHPDIEPSLAMPPYLESHLCGQGFVSLTFQDSGHFLLESEQPVGDDFQLSRHRGQWRFDGKQLRLAPEGGATVRFEKYIGSEETPVGPRQAEYYRPTGHSELPELSCTFSLVHMDSNGFSQ